MTRDSKALLEVLKSHYSKEHLDALKELATISGPEIDKALLNWFKGIKFDSDSYDMSEGVVGYSIFLSNTVFDALDCCARLLYSRGYDSVIQVMFDMIDSINHQYLDQFDFISDRTETVRSSDDFYKYQNKLIHLIVEIQGESVYKELVSRIPLWNPTDEVYVMNETIVSILVKAGPPVIPIVIEYFGEKVSGGFSGTNVILETIRRFGIPGLNALADFVVSKDGFNKWTLEERGGMDSWIISEILWKIFSYLPERYEEIFFLILSGKYFDEDYLGFYFPCDKDDIVSKEIGRIDIERILEAIDSSDLRTIRAACNYLYFDCEMGKEEIVREKLLSSLARKPQAFSIIYRVLDPYFYIYTESILKSLTHVISLDDFNPADHKYALQDIHDLLTDQDLHPEVLELIETKLASFNDDDGSFTN